MPAEVKTQKWTFDDLNKKLLSIMGDIDHCIETDWLDAHAKENEIFVLSGWTRQEYEEEDRNLNDYVLLLSY